jgi:hypothetical protein
MSLILPCRATHCHQKLRTPGQDLRQCVRIGEGVCLPEAPGHYRDTTVCSSGVSRRRIWRHFWRLRRWRRWMLR